MEEPIAIIGIGCRFPGGVTDTDSFWQLLTNKVDAITQMPSGRYDIDHYYDPNLTSFGKVITREGGYLDKIDTFDAAFFNISAYEARYMDPQQRLLLEVTWEALEDAGLIPTKMRQSNTGVFVGMWLNDYEDIIYSASDDIDLHTTIGAGRYPASGRLSYMFDFRGPSMTLDTACSSGLVSVHLACQSLRNGESDMAVAGAANVILQPQISIAYSRSGMLSPDARCKFGDAAANGYVRSDGAAVLLLKRLSDAIRDGDPIRALIRGSIVNNDGQAGDSLVTPSLTGQANMLREAYRAAGVEPGQVGYIEAHGTGTRVGDPIELEAIGSVVSEGRPADMPCWVGSVKSNIGHTESVSGIAGMIKTVLALEHGQIPPNLHFHEPNPNIPWSEMPFRVPTETIPWPPQAKGRYAGISSFGVTGTNAHVVLEAAPQLDETTQDAAETTDHLVLPISAHTPAAVAELVDKYKQFVADNSQNIRDIVHTATAHRTHHTYRTAFVGQSAQELSEQLANWNGQSREATPRKVTFVFPGQGGQWLGMGRQLMEAEPVFREMIERCETAMQPYIDFSLVWALTSAEAEAAFEDIGVVQPAIFAVQVGLAELWRSKGIVPDAVIGHSMGEVAAAYTAGALSLEDAAAVICLRSQLMRRVSGLGAMAVAELSLQEAQSMLAGYEGQLSVAVNNAPRSVVISGDAAALEQILTELQARDIFCRRVKVDVAAHSPHMDALRPELVNALSGLHAQNTAIGLYSTVTGSARAGQDFDAVYWGRNLREPVLFSDAVQEALGDGYNTFVELGPHPVLLPAIERGLSDYNLDQAQLESIVLVESMRRDEDQTRVIAESLARLYSAGYDLDWTCLYPTGRIVSLPGFPWQRERYWVDVDLSALITKAAATASGEESWRNWLYEPNWEAIDHPSAQPMESGHWLVFADDTGIGETLSNQLVHTGHTVHVVRHGAGFATNGHEITVNPGQSQDFGQLLENAGQLAGIVYLWGADLPAGMELSAEDVASGQEETLGGLLRLTQALVEKRQTAPIWIVTRGAQRAGEENSQLAPAQGTLWGLGRVIREEHPDLWGGLIDLDPQSADHAAEALWNEISARDGEDQTAYRSGQRYALRLVQAELKRGTKNYTFRKDGTYLITGGLGDIGAVLAKWMVNQGARRFILMGRTELPPRAQWNQIPAEGDLGRKIRTVRDLEAMGASVHVASVDVANESELRAYLDTFQNEGWPPIVGVIHAAGVADDYLISKLTDDALMGVLRPKVTGGWLLHNLLGDVELFVLFSSIGGLLGLPGQGNYAAANTFLNSLAAYRRSLGYHALTIDWGVWKDLGFAVREGGQVTASHLSEMGVESFAADDGFAALAALLAADTTHAVVVPANWAQYTASRESRRFPLFTHLMGVAANAPAKISNGTSLHNQLLSAPAETRSTVLKTYLRDIVGQILRISSAKIKYDEALGTYGINSLMGMELRNRLERDLGLTLSATLVWNYPTIETMSAYLIERLGLVVQTTSESPAAQDTPAVEEPALGNIIADVSLLSDDDILKALMDKS